MDNRSLPNASEKDNLRSHLTRRQTLPVLAASLGGAFLNRNAAGASLRNAVPEPVSGTNKSGDFDKGTRVYNVREFGAKGDAVALDTPAVQSAIDACAGDGGGTVLVPSGVFRVGTLELKSNITFHIAAGGKLLGSAEGKDYHAVDSIPLKGDSTLEDGNWALLYAVNATNVTIEGPGTIDGQGIQFHSAVRGTSPPSGLGGSKRPYHLLFYQCENLRVRDIDLLESAYHSIRVIRCKRVHMDGIYIHNRVNGNNDGFHFVSCEFVTVTNCTVLSQDDACALFGSCRYVAVTNSFFSTRWSCFRFGSGVARDITVSNCVLFQVYGCPIKFQGVAGNRFENMSFSNLIFDDVTGPISVSMGPREVHGSQGGPRPDDAVPQVTKEPPVMRNISFSNIQGTVTTTPQPLPGFPFPGSYNPGERHSAIVLNCVKGAIAENISFDNVHLTFGGGGTAEDAARRDVPEVAGEYFQLGPIPAFGLYARNVSGITMNNVRFEVETPDLRPALILDHCNDVAISALTVEGNAEAESSLRFIHTQKVLITAPRLLKQAKVFLQLEGASASGIIVDGGDLSTAAETLAFRNEAEKKAVKLRD